MKFRATMLKQADVPAWISMRAELWPDADPEELATEGPASLLADPPLVVFIVENDETPVGFLELSLRSYAEGCVSSPVPYVEGWYVAPGFRREGVGSALMEAAVRWSREQGYTELASDALASNLPSHAAHRALGFDEIETIVVFRRDLRTA